MRWTLVVLALLPFVGQARAHGPGTDWLMDGDYRNSEGEHCCSPGRDCQPIPNRDLELTPMGWKYLPTGEVVSERDTFLSRDPLGQHWRCQGAILWRDNKRLPEKTRCLFIAPGRS